MQQWAAKAQEKLTKLMAKDVPLEYQKHQQVFMEEEAEQLPPKRVENMTIPLKKEAPPQMDCKTYLLSTKEMEVLRQALKEDLQKGYIRHGSSSYVSPIFFIPKKDGKELCMVIDYQKLNDVTIKDFYPLLNLQGKLEKLSAHRLFSKFDVWVGYNNIHIEDEDQYKATFKTPLGTFIPMVITFGFCNAPTIFQHAMNQDLAELKQTYPDHFANYMDNVAIGMKDDIKGRKLHQQIVNEFLAVLKKHSYYLKASKCAFKQVQIAFLRLL